MFLSRGYISLPAVDEEGVVAVHCVCVAQGLAITPAEKSLSLGPFLSAISPLFFSFSLCLVLCFERPEKKLLQGNFGQLPDHHK